ncbi:MAG: dienelactone hydrolase family protein [Candidatus Acidiferrales bacterium]
MVEVVSQRISLSVSDGTSMDAYVARPKTDGPHPALLLFQEAFGVNSHIRDVAERFARAGLVVIAPELFHRTATAGFEAAYDNFAAAASHLKAITPETLKLDIRAAYDWLRDQSGVRADRIASVGFCLGGRVSFLACATVPIQAAVSFYGGGIAPALLGEIPNLHATMLFFWGGLDKHIGKDQIRSVIDACDRDGKAFVNVEVSNADHGFFCDARPSYNPAAAELGWKLSLSFLNLHIMNPERRTRLR